MSGSKKRKPRDVHLNSIERAIESVRLIEDSQVSAMRKQTQDTFDAFKRGERPQECWAVLADTLNLAEAMSVNICSDDGSKIKIQDAMDAMAEIVDHWRTSGSWSLLEIESNVIKEALWVYSTQLEFVSLGEFEKARLAVTNRVQAALAGNAGKNMKVVRP